MQLREVYTGQLTIRQLRVLIRGLPGDSRLATLLRRQRREAGDLPVTPIEQLPPETWSHEAWLLADVHDVLTQLCWLTVCAHSPTDTPRPPQPQPIPRPTGTGRRTRGPGLGAWLAAAGHPHPPPPHPPPGG